MHKSSWILAVSLALTPVAGVASSFESRPLPEVLKQAGAEGKLGFVDFYANWCDPCKHIDATLFPDPKVKAWLHEHTVPVAIDGERGQGPEVRERYKLKFYPTLLLLKPDGTEMGRFAGSIEVDDFLSTFEDIRNGVDQLAALQKAVAADPQNLEKRMELADMLGEKDQADAAREHLEAVLQGDSGLAGTAARQLLAGETQDEKLEAAVDGRIEGLLQLALAGKASTAQLEAVSGLLAARDRSEDMVKLEAARRADQLDPGLRFDLARRAFRVHMAAKRYDEASLVARAATETLEKQQPAADASAEDRWNARFRLSHLYGELYKAELLAGKAAEAKAVAEHSLGLDADVNNYNRLAWAAFEAEKSDDYALGLARKGHELAKGEDLNMADTLANVLQQMGKTPEALEVIDAAMKTTTLEKRLKEFRELRESITNPKKSDDKS